METESKVKEHENSMIPEKKSAKGAIVAIILVIVISLLAILGTWYYMNNKANNDKKALDAQIQQLEKQIDDLKSQASSSAKTVDTNMIAYEVSGTPLSLKYPKGWYTLGCPRSAGDYTTIDFFASTKATLGVCNSDAIGQISASTSKNSKYIQTPNSWSNSSATINGINMQRYEAPANQPYAQGSNTTLVRQVGYYFNKNGYYYSLNYVQTNQMPDVYSDFLKIVNSVTIN